MQPNIFSIDAHQIPPNKIDPHAFYVIQKLRQKGYKAYLVGGSVRDLLLNRQPKDFDISTSARPEEIRKLFRNCLLIGRRFRLAHVRFGQKILEVSTFRSGKVDETNLILRDNVWGNAEEDVLRRDFTINGLFYDPEEQVVIDYVGGYEDTNNKLLRTIGDPEIRFKQDPVRMIRLIKFYSRFDFQIEEQTKKAVHTCKKEIIKSSSARILEELFRMLESGSAEPFFKNLHEFGFLQLLMPRLAQYFSENLEDNLVLKYLAEIDNINWKDFSLSIDRPVLICGLLYPLLVEKTKNKHVHLGMLYQMVKDLIEDVFDTFFLLSRKIKACIISILTAQYRFTPLIQKAESRIRIPKDPFFDLAMNFFKIRVEMEPDLLKTYTKWNEALFHKMQKQTKKIGSKKSVPLETPSI